MDDLKNMNFESGWKIIKEEAIEKIEKYIEGNKIEKKENLFSAREYTRLYTVVYNLCARKTPHCYSKEVYRKYGESLSEYIIIKMKPLLRNENDFNKIKLLIDAWVKYSFYTKWMNKFLRYLDRYYVEYNCSLCLSAYTKNIFKMTIFNELRGSIRSVVYNIYENIREAQEKRERKQEKGKLENEEETKEKGKEETEKEEAEKEEAEKEKKEIEQKKVFYDLVQLYKELDKESKEKMYEQDIEKNILENIDSHYKHIVDKLIAELPFDDYIRSIENFIEKEYDKNKSLNLTDEACEKVTNIIVKILIFDKLDTLLSNKANIFDLLKYKKLGCLRRTYILFSYFPKAIKGLKELIGEYVKGEGNSLKEKYVALSKNIADGVIINNDVDFTNVGTNDRMQNTKNDLVGAEIKKEKMLCGYIEELIQLHNYYDELFKVSFYNIAHESIDINFKECLKEYFETFVEHEDENFSTVKLLVLYADSILKQDENDKTSKTENRSDEEQKEILHTSDKAEEIEGGNKMDKKIKTVKTNIAAEKNVELGSTEYLKLVKKISEVVEIFNYTSNKEAFFEYYRIYLANRLISNIYISLEAEKKFIQCLYCLYGSQFTSKLGGMIQDVSDNININKRFFEFCEKKCITNQELLNIQNMKNTFCVQILNKGYWPILEKTPMKLNNEFNKNIQMFEEHFKLENKNKKLEWSFDISEVVLEYLFANGTTYYLHCNVINAHIFLLFNTYEYINFKIIENELKLDLKTFSNNMNSCLNDIKIIYCNDSTVDWESSNFYINPNFTSPSKKIRIKKTTAVSSKEHEKIKEDRSMAIEAAIVRVMKVHKTLFYDQIFEYVKETLAHFAPSNKAIEKKIDLLLEREYLQKQENSQLYTYVP